MLNLNRPLNFKEVDSVIKNLSTKKSPGLDGFSEELELPRRANTYIPQSIPHNRNRRNIANSFYEAIGTLIPKAHKDSTKKENYRTISFMNTYSKILNKILTNT